jgi:hypothetical protein
MAPSAAAGGGSAMATHKQGPSLLNRAMDRAQGWRDRGSVAQRLYPRLAHSAAEPKPQPEGSASIAERLYPNLRSSPLTPVPGRPLVPQPPSIAAALYPGLPNASEPQGGKP